MLLRLAVETDLPRIVSIWMAMMEEHRGFEPRIALTPEAGPAYQSYLLLHLRNPRSIVVVAEEDERLIGFCCAYVCQNLPMFEPTEFGYVSDLFLAPESRRRGNGSEILNHVIGWFRDRGVACVQLQVYEKNETGKKFWTEKGFRPFLERRWLDL